MATFDSERYRALRNGTSSRYYTDMDTVLTADIGQVTSRDQIIDPYELVQANAYKNNGKGRRQYESDLQRAMLYAERQEAAYQEWYNREQQQVTRQEEAGLNPDLLGIDSGNSVASDTEQSHNIPGTNLPTDGQIATQTIGAIGSFAGAVGSIVTAGANLAALPSQIAATKAAQGASIASAALSGAQTLQTNLTTAKMAEGHYYNDIVGRVASARQSFINENKGSDKQFDLQAFLSNADNFAGLYETFAVEDTPLFRNAYNNAFKQYARIHGDSSKVGANAVANQTEFATAMANPYYDSNELFQIAALEPVYQAMENLRLKKLDFDKKYLDASDPEREAAAKLLTLEAEAIINNTQASIDSHFRSIWEDKSKSFDVRAGALYQLTGGQGQQWAAWLTSYAASQGVIQDVVNGLSSGDVPPEGTPQPSAFSGNNGGFRHYGQNFYQFPNGMNFGN